MDTREYVMLYSKQSGGYIFIALNNTKQEEPIRHHKIGTYTNDTETYVINRITYSKQKCVDMINNLESSFCMDGPDLYVITGPNNDNEYICIWKTKLTDGLEICCNEKNAHLLFNDENKNLLEETNKFLNTVNNLTYKLSFDNPTNVFNTHHY